MNRDILGVACWQMPWMAAEHGRATVDELLHEGIALTLRPYMQACEA
jgi:hypothetical protein